MSLFLIFVGSFLAAVVSLLATPWAIATRVTVFYFIVVGAVIVYYPLSGTENGLAGGVVSLSLMILGVVFLGRFIFQIDRFRYLGSEGFKEVDAFLSGAGGCIVGALLATMLSHFFPRLLMDLPSMG